MSNGRHQRSGRRGPIVCINRIVSLGKTILVLAIGWGLITTGNEKKNLMATVGEIIRHRDCPRGKIPVKRLSLQIIDEMNLLIPGVLIIILWTVFKLEPEALDFSWLLYC